jgi:hypothetical protein
MRVRERGYISGNRPLGTEKGFKTGGLSSPGTGKSFDRLRYKKEDVRFISVRKRQW